MDNLMQNLSSAHPIIIVAIIFIGLLAVYFLFKQLLKMALVLALILLAVGGYFYLKDPKQMPRNMMETLDKAVSETGKVIEKGKEAYSKGKAIAEKGKKMSEGMDNLRVGTNRKPDQAENQAKKNSK